MARKVLSLTGSGPSLFDEHRRLESRLYALLMPFNALRDVLDDSESASVKLLLDRLYVQAEIDMLELAGDIRAEVSHG